MAEDNQAWDISLGWISLKTIANGLIGTAIFYILIWQVPEWFFTFTDLTANIYAAAVRMDFSGYGSDMQIFFFLDERAGLCVKLFFL